MTSAASPPGRSLRGPSRLHKAPAEPGADSGIMLNLSPDVPLSVSTVNASESDSSDTTEPLDDDIASPPSGAADASAEGLLEVPLDPELVPDEVTGLGGSSVQITGRRGSESARRALKAAREEEAEVDHELVKRAQKGDAVAFRKLVERHQRRAFAIALGLVRHEQDARDIVQDAFLRVHKSLGGFQGGSSFFTWLYRIVTNLAIDLVRRPGRNVDELEEDRHRTSSPGGGEQPDPMWVSRVDGADPIDVLRRKELAVRMREAIDALPSYHKAVILMREVEGLSYEEMAEAMNVSKGTIMSRLFHARQKLQKTLADCYAEENGR